MGVEVHTVGEPLTVHNKRVEQEKLRRKANRYYFGVIACATVMLCALARTPAYVLAHAGDPSVRTDVVIGLIALLLTLTAIINKWVYYKCRSAYARGQLDAATGRVPTT